jgi:hypothetical protein
MGLSGTFDRLEGRGMMRGNRRVSETFRGFWRMALGTFGGSEGAHVAHFWGRRRVLKFREVKVALVGWRGNLI